MDIFKFNKKVLSIAILVFLLGAVLTFIAFSALGFDFQSILTHLGPWYSSR